MLTTLLCFIIGIAVYDKIGFSFNPSVLFSWWFILVVMIFIVGVVDWVVNEYFN